MATEDSHKEPLRALLWSNGFVENETEILSYAGCSKVDSALVLGGFLQEKAPHVHLVVHRDADYCSQAASVTFVERLDRGGVAPFLTERNDVESYFLNAEHLHALNPSVSLDRVRELLLQATVETAAKSLAAIVNQRTTEAFQRRREGGPQPDHGEIAVRAQEEYAADPEGMRRGKEVLGRLRALLQTEMGTNPRIFFPSEHLRSVSLRAIAERVRA